MPSAGVIVEQGEGCMYVKVRLGTCCCSRCQVECLQQHWGMSIFWGWLCAVSACSKH